MDQNLSLYPPTADGTKDVLLALTPAIKKLWRSERAQHNTDDLVVLIDIHKNTVRLTPRASVYTQLKHHDPKISLLARLKNPAPSPNGTVTLWVITGFTEGNVFISPVVVAQS
jgi:hypothetical protein